jgi:S-adenosylmethionine hydrolase
MRDHYVGAMRGVALGICPDVTLADITHEIAPQDVSGRCARARRGIQVLPAKHGLFVCRRSGCWLGARADSAAEAAGYRFVAPDNGLLTMVFRETAPAQVVELTDRRYARKTISRTFEGRDRFAPAAAWLATGIEVRALGTPVTTWEMLDVAEPPSGLCGQLSGIVLRVDRFGNLVHQYRPSQRRCLRGRRPD